MKLLQRPIKMIKKLLCFLFSRPVLVALMLLLQIAIFVLVPVYFSPYIKPIHLALRILSYTAIFWVISKDINPAFKISWIVLFFFFPIAGQGIYFLVARQHIPDKLEEHMRAHLENIEHFVPHHQIVEPQHGTNRVQSQYIRACSGYPAMEHTSVEYYSVGDTMFPAMLESIELAEKYIFLEFFIVKTGKVLTDLMEVIQRKLKQGVEVFFMFDDVGTMFHMSVEYEHYLRDLGIHLCIFNPFRPHISPILNYRDHRKILVVDGDVAFCGGMNLADEYINVEDRFGHWKDTGVKLTGQAAWSFALMFMQQWRFGTGEGLHILDYRPVHQTNPPSDGMVQVYGDSPLTEHNIAENVYLNAIRQAKHYIYITSPYLVIDYAMENALCSAAASGVDVRIITPYHYDKWYVHMLTQSHYKKLIAGGVKIYEYTPGFIHSKMFVADDIIATVGTSNLDFRSLYHHFECSVLLYQNSKIQTIKEDFLSCQETSQHITLDIATSTPFFRRLAQMILKVFAPLL